MLYNDPYPYLKHLLGAYFHQDALDDGDSDEDIIREFCRVAQPYEVLGVRADIARFLHQADPDKGLLAAFNDTFSPDLSFGESDEALRKWLASTALLLETEGTHA